MRFCLWIIGVILLSGGLSLPAGEPKGDSRETVRPDVRGEKRERRRAENAEQKVARLEEERAKQMLQLKEREEQLEILLRQRNELDEKLRQSLRNWGEQATVERELRSELQKERVKFFSLQDQMAEQELLQREQEVQLKEKQQQLETVRQLLSEKRTDERVPYLVDVWAHLEMEISRQQIVNMDARKEAATFRSQVVSLREELQGVQSRNLLLQDRLNQGERQRQGVEERLREQELQLLRWKHLVERSESLEKELMNLQEEMRGLQEQNRILVQLVQKAEARDVLEEGAGKEGQVNRKPREIQTLSEDQLSELRRLRVRVEQLERLIQEAPELQFSAPVSCPSKKEEAK